MTLLDRNRPRPCRERGSPSSRRSGSSLRAPRLERRRSARRAASTTAASRRTPRASRIPTRSRTPRNSSRRSTERTARSRSLVTLRDGTLRRRLRRRPAAPASDPEIGYWIGVPYWGNGYATEAARAVIDHAFDELGHEVLRRRRAREQPGLAARAGEVRLPVDRRGARCASARSAAGAVRPLPARPRRDGGSSSPRAPNATDRSSRACDPIQNLSTPSSTIDAKRPVLRLDAHRPVAAALLEVQRRSFGSCLSKA